MSLAFAAGLNRPDFVTNGRVVARRAMSHGGVVYKQGQEVPRLDLTDRQVAILWDQGWVDTLPAEPAPAKSDPRRK